MRVVVKFLITCLVGVSAYATSYVYVEEGVKLPLNDTILYAGAPLKKVGDSFRVEGYVKNGEPKNLYATKNFKLLLATSDRIKATQDKGILDVKLEEDNYTEDSEEAWEQFSERFYEKCTQCHPAKVVEDHTMLEWEGLFGSMKEFAKPTKEDTTFILRFLRGYAKDGIVKEVD